MVSKKLMVVCFFPIVANIIQLLLLIRSTIIQAAFDPEAFKKFFILDSSDRCAFWD